MENIVHGTVWKCSQHQPSWVFLLGTPYAYVQLRNLCCTVYEVGGRLEERVRGGHPPTNFGDGCLDLDT